MVVYYPQIVSFSGFECDGLHRSAPVDFADQLEAERIGLVGSDFFHPSVAAKIKPENGAHFVVAMKNATGVYDRSSNVEYVDRLDPKSVAKIAARPRMKFAAFGGFRDDDDGLPELIKHVAADVKFLFALGDATVDVGAASAHAAVTFFDAEKLTVFDPTKALQHVGRAIAISRDRIHVKWTAGTGQVDSVKCRLVKSQFAEEIAGFVREINAHVEHNGFSVDSAFYLAVGKRAGQSTPLRQGGWLNVA